MCTATACFFQKIKQVSPFLFCLQVSFIQWSLSNQSWEVCTYFLSFYFMFIQKCDHYIFSNTFAFFANLALQNHVFIYAIKFHITQCQNLNSLKADQTDLIRSGVMKKGQTYRYKYRKTGIGWAVHSDGDALEANKLSALFYKSEWRRQVYCIQLHGGGRLS